MAETSFQATVESGAKGPTIRLTGTINRAAKERLEEAYEDASALAGDLTLDFSETEYINSTGIAVIVGLLARARATDREIGAFGLTDHYREVFEITRLSDFMRIYDNAHNKS